MFKTELLNNKQAKKYNAIDEIAVVEFGEINTIRSSSTYRRVCFDDTIKEMVDAIERLFAEINPHEKLRIRFTCKNTDLNLDIFGKRACGYECHKQKYSMASAITEWLNVIIENFDETTLEHKCIARILKDINDNGYLQCKVKTDIVGHPREIAPVGQHTPDNLYITAEIGPLIVPFSFKAYLIGDDSLNRFRELLHEYKIPVTLGTIYKDVHQLVDKENDNRKKNGDKILQVHCLESTEENLPLIIRIGLGEKYRQQAFSYENTLKHIKEMTENI